jgi:bacterioferritin
MSCAAELESRVVREFNHAITIARQIENLCSIRLVQPRAAQRSTKCINILPMRLASEPEAFQGYRVRIRQCERLGEYEVAEQIRGIMIEEQEHSVAQAAGQERKALPQSAVSHQDLERAIRFGAMRSLNSASS